MTNKTNTKDTLVEDTLVKVLENILQVANSHTRCRLLLVAYKELLSLPQEETKKVLNELLSELK